MEGIVRKKFACLGLLCGLVAVTQVCPAEPAALAKASQTYRERLAALQQEHEASVRQVADGCRRALDAFIADARKKGQLEAVLAATRVRERLNSSDRTDDPPEVEDPELARIERECRGKLFETDIAGSRKILKLTESYAAYLEKQKRELTKAGKIEVAVAFKRALEGLPSTPAVLAARTILGNASQDPEQTLSDERDIPLPPELRRGLVLYYSFDEQDQDQARDLSGRGNHGWFVNYGRGATFVPSGKRGAACEFSGAGATVRCKPDKNLDLNGGLTLSVWVQTKKSGASMILISGWRKYVLWVQDNNELRLADHNGHYVDTKPGLLDPGQWHHVVGVFRGTRGDRINHTNAKIYVDDVLRGRRTDGKWSPGKLEAVVFGETGNSRFLLDEVMIFDRALSVLEVKALYEAADAPVQAPPPSVDLSPIIPPKPHPVDAVAFRGHWYKLLDERMDWHQARTRCRNMGGQLVCISDGEENRFVANLAKPRAGWGVWIGATDEEREGRWLWVDGADVTYTNWHRGEPNNGGGTEHVAILSRTGSWEDWAAANTNRIGFVCEWDH